MMDLAQVSEPVSNAPYVKRDGSMYDSLNDIDREKLVLVKYFMDKSARSKLANNIRPEYFLNPEMRAIVSEIKAYIKDNGSGRMPSLKDLISYSDCHGRKEQMKTSMAVLRVYEQALMPEDLKSSDKSLEHFIKSHAFHHLAMSGMSDTNNISKYLNELSKLNGFSLEQASGMFVGGDSYSYTDTATDDGIVFPTFLPFLNENMRGGMHTASMNVWLATQGVGKSWFLYKNAFNIFKYTNQDVMILSLELSKNSVNDRLVSIATGLSKDQLAEMCKTHGKEWVDNYVLQAMTPYGHSEYGKKARIYIEQGAARKYSVPDLDRKLEELEVEEGFRPIHIAADYLTLFRCGDVGPGAADNMYLMGKFLAEDLRAVGVSKKLSIDTAAQLGRGAYNNISASHESVGISRAITETADSMIYITDNELLKNRQVKKLSMDKNRYGPSNITRYVSIDYSRGYMEQVDEATDSILSNEVAANEKNNRQGTWQ